MTPEEILCLGLAYAPDTVDGLLEDISIGEFNTLCTFFGIPLLPFDLIESYEQKKEARRAALILRSYLRLWRKERGLSQEAFRGVQSNRTNASVLNFAKLYQVDEQKLQEMWAAQAQSKKDEPRAMGVTIEKVMAQVLREAEHLELNSAPTSQARALLLRTQVEFYKYGRGLEVPPQWLKAQRSVVLKEDPEWAEYQRLAKKFEGRDG